MDKKFRTSYPITMLHLLGREWHAEYYVNRVREGCVGSLTVSHRLAAESSARSALSLDY